MEENSTRLTTAVFWTASTKWVAQIVSWASLLLLARYLTPVDFGITGMAFGYLGFMNLVSEFGVGSAIISLRSLTTTQIAAINTLSACLGAFAFLFSVSLASGLSIFFRIPDLAPAIMIMSLTFVISGFRSVPYALLQKELSFRKLAFADALGTLTQCVFAVPLAIIGFGHWSIIIGLVSGVLINSILVVRWKPAPFGRPKYYLLRDTIVFSWRTVVSRIAWYSYSTADFAVAGRLLGPSLLGVYSVAWNFAHIPSEKLVALVLTVTPTFFSAAQYDKEELRRSFIRVCEILLVVICPAIGGIAVVAPDLVPLLLGHQWITAVKPLQMLLFYTILNSVIAIIGQVLMISGDTRFSMWMNLTMMVVLPLGFLYGSKWGPVGIASVWLFVYPFLSLVWFGRVFQKLVIKPEVFIRRMAPAVMCSLIMIVILIGLTMFGLQSAPGWIRVFAQIVAGVLSYVFLMRLMFAKEAIDYFLMAKAAIQAIKKPRGAETLLVNP